MPITKRKLSRRDLLQLVAASGAISMVPTITSAADTPPPCDSLSEAELIGVLLWAAFKKGAGITEIPKDVAERGAERSGPPIKLHLQDGLEKFPYDKTMQCALEAGTIVKRQAAGGTISVANFDYAWDYVHEQQVKAMKRLSQQKKGDVRMLGGAC